MKRRALVQVTVVAATFAAGAACGWFFKPMSSDAGGGRITVLNRGGDAHAVAAGQGRGTLAGAWSEGGGAGDAGALPPPFTSLEELLTQVGGWNLFDEVSTAQLMGALPRLLMTDVAATRRLLAELDAAAAPQGEARTMVAAALLARWMMQDAESAIAFAAGHQKLLGADDDSLEEMASFGIAMMAGRDPAKARAMLALLPEDQREQAEETLAVCEALRDPAAFLTGKPLKDLRNPDDVAKSWARRDPAAAAGWVKSLEGEDFEKMVPVVAEGWAFKDKDGALAWALALPDSTARAAALTRIAEALTEDVSPEDAEKLVAGMPPEVADRALMQNYNGTADPAKVKELLERHAGDEEFHSMSSSAVQNAASSLMDDTGGQKAAAWLTGLPEGEARTSAAQAVAREWVQKDQVAASEWVASLGAGEMRDRAVVGLLDHIAERDAERAFAWAVSLPEGNLRREQARRVLNHWVPDDPVAAMEAMNVLPEEVRAGLVAAPKDP